MKIELRGISKSYGRLAVLKDVGFQLETDIFQYSQASVGFTYPAQLNLHQAFLPLSLPPVPLQSGR